MPEIELSEIQRFNSRTLAESDVLLEELVHRLGHEAATLEAEARSVRARIARLQQESGERWRELLKLVGDEAGVQVPLDAQLVRSDGQISALHWEDPEPPSAPAIPASAPTDGLEPRASA